MASVSSLDKDLSKLRLSKYTAQSASEVREWIRNVLGESAIGDEDLMEELKSGVVLCRLVNKLIPNAAKFKTSAMPFVQMENISLFLRILSLPPLSLPPHDLFLTVDLYESKDPAQVLQTLQSFSRVANSQNPTAFPVVIGPKKPSSSGMASPTYGSQSRFISPNSTGNNTKGKPPIPSRSTGVSSWSKPTDEYKTAPAWNIHQYGYMGGASQGNQNVVMGGRRQITSAGPSVPNLREKEERRKREELESEEARVVEEEMRRRREEEEERRQQAEEEERWERQAEEDRKQYKLQEEQAELARRQREAKEAEQQNHENRRLERMKRELEERIAREAEEKRQHENHEAREAQRRRQTDRIEYSFKGIDSDRLASNFGGPSAKDEIPLSNSSHGTQAEGSSESQRIKELERELELAREREKKYQREMEAKNRESQETSEAPSLSKVDNDDTEREFLKSAWSNNNDSTPRPLPDSPVVSSTRRPLPTPSKSSSKPLPHGTLAAQRQRELQNEADAEDEQNSSSAAQETSNDAPPMPPRNTTSSTQSGPKWGSRWSGGSRFGSVLNKPGGGMSLVEREMELERQRQREWEMNQQQLQEDRGKMTDKEKSDDSPAWDVNQYGYTGGANQGSEQVSFGAKRQIIGPRSQR